MHLKGSETVGKALPKRKYLKKEGKRCIWFNYSQIVLLQTNKSQTSKRKRHEMLKKLIEKNICSKYFTAINFIYIFEYIKNQLIKFVMHFGKINQSIIN